MGKEPKGEEPKGDGRVNKGHFFQPGHLLARLTGVGGAAAASVAGAIFVCGAFSTVAPRAVRF